MVLSMVAIRDETIGRLHREPSLVWRVIDEEDGGFEDVSGAKPGFFARLFGRSKPPVPTPMAEDFEFAEDEGELCDLDKAWHFIHFLLTGTAWEGSGPEAFLLNGGREVGKVDVGYGPARTLRSDEVAEVAATLRELDEETLRSRIDPPRMDELEIYPGGWTDVPGDDEVGGHEVGYALELFEFVDGVERSGLGLLVWLS